MFRPAKRPCLAFVKFLVAGACFTLALPGKTLAQGLKPVLKVGYTASPGSFPLATSKSTFTLITDTADKPVVQIAAKAFAGDVERVTGKLPKLGHTMVASGTLVIAGTIGHHQLIDGLIKTGRLNVAQVKGKWETFSITVVPRPFKNVAQALVITGSDYRGTAFGLFELSRMIGVQPFYWWADVTPEHHNELYLTPGQFVSAPPSVKFRGIFINDEDWGLQPWAAKTFEPETGDIGPKTYAKVFELLLRLKANLIWPAMHPSTKAFFHYPGNIKMAEQYQIVVGSSHAEPMLRNNVSEWNEQTMGKFNYLTNKAMVSAYWESRVKESSQADVIYTMGMRGVHDSGIEGVKTVKETVPLLERIMADQREMLKKIVNPDIAKVPQALTIYKEVLDVYDGGLKVPDDITIVWPDDNYGYIQRLDNEAEAQRAGGSGVYYHTSYWGRPHDYLWLSTASPVLMREEMTKAYDLQARNIWVLNVGDIKPAEYGLSFFLDMAYNIAPFKNSSYVKTHLGNWVADNLGRKNAGEVTSVLWDHYKLAFERRPEFMGWSQTEPTTKTKLTEYNHFYYGDQAQQRIDAYDALAQKVKVLRGTIDNPKQDAFYQLVYYPVTGAALMNKKFLYRDKAYLYARQGRLSANNYAAMSNAAYQHIVDETTYYNTRLAGGKWAGIMSMEPRGLPVYKAPEIDYQIAQRPEVWLVQAEGAEVGSAVQSLPKFRGLGQKYFVDVFLCKDSTLTYLVRPSAPWISVSQQTGALSAKANQTRLWVSVDAAKLPAGQTAAGNVTISSGAETFTIAVKAAQNDAGYQGAAANNGYIAIAAKNYQQMQKQGNNAWVATAGAGRADGWLEALPLKISGGVKGDLADSELRKQASVSYNFSTDTVAAAEVRVYTIPTYPINKNFSVRYAVSVDDGPATVLDFKTVGRSEEWKQNVLSNSAMRLVNLPVLPAGKHVLHIYMIDPGVILDKIIIDLGGLKPFYGAVPETK